MADNDVFLQIRGESFTGWKIVDITRSMEAASGAFTLTVVDYNPETLSDYQIKEGDECRVVIGSDPVITGYIDTVNPSFSDNSFGVTVQGRDKTSDIVDCSATGKSELRNKSLISIARDFCEPFKISVLSEDGQDSAISVRLNPKANKSISQKARRRKQNSAKFAGENIGVFRTQPGETILECLERVAREKGLLITSNTNGDLVFTRSGKVSSESFLEEGINILGGNSSFSTKDRFSEYTVNAQAPGGSTSNVWKASKSVATDENIKRYRPLVILAEAAMNQAGARRRATWEAAVRAARAMTVSIDVPEWRNDTGALWEVNTLVNVKSPSLRVDRELLITEIRFSLNESGRTTTLQLKRPDAFALETDNVLPNNEIIKPPRPIKPKTKKVIPKKKTFKKKTPPKPVSRSRDLVLNTATSSETTAS